MGRKCNVCEPMLCNRAFLYVVEDEMRGLVKIGCTVNVSRRMSNYRANGNTFYRLVAKFDTGGCDFTATKKERRALNSLDPAARVRGDWFDVDPAVAVRAAERAIAGRGSDE